jgi:hypothetical protein
MAYVSRNLILDGAGKTLAANETDTVVSETLRINNPTHLIVDFYVSAVTNGSGTIVAEVQDSSGQDSWNSGKQSAAITSTGWKTIRLLDTVAGDATYLPLRPLVRLTATTGAADAITITNVMVSYEER